MIPASMLNEEDRLCRCLGRIEATIRPSTLMVKCRVCGRARVATEKVIILEMVQTREIDVVVGEDMLKLVTSDDGKTKIIGSRESFVGKPKKPIVYFRVISYNVMLGGKGKMAVADGMAHEFYSLLAMDSAMINQRIADLVRRDMDRLPWWRRLFKKYDV